MGGGTQPVLRRAERRPALDAAVRRALRPALSRRTRSLVQAEKPANFVATPLCRRTNARFAAKRVYGDRAPSLQIQSDRIFAELTRPRHRINPAQRERDTMDL